MSVKKNEVQNEVVIESVAPTYNVNKLLEELKSKSSVIRYLNSQGLDCKSIYKLLSDSSWTNNSGTHPIRYQHVRNVLVTVIKKK